MQSQTENRTIKKFCRTCHTLIRWHIVDGRPDLSYFVDDNSKDESRHLCPLDPNVPSKANLSLMSLSREDFNRARRDIDEQFRATQKSISEVKGMLKVLLEKRGTV
jgi:hypothetical protein